jgi:hypothetical protein
VRWQICETDHHVGISIYLSRRPTGAVEHLLWFETMGVAALRVEPCCEVDPPAVGRAWIAGSAIWADLEAEDQSVVEVLVPAGAVLHTASVTLMEPGYTQEARAAVESTDWGLRAFVAAWLRDLVMVVCLAQVHIDWTVRQ